MKKIALLLPMLGLSACLTINMIPQPKRDSAALAGVAPEIHLKPSAESVNFVDPIDGFTYKWVKVRVWPTNSITSIYSGRSDVLSPGSGVLSTAPVLTPPPPATASTMRETPKMDTFRDDRDGHVYQTVSIGHQMWMAQNLNFKTAEGSMYYDNDPKNGEPYGMLYSYKALAEACPKGWHLPSDAEWKQLEYSIGMSHEDADKEMYRGNVAANLLEGGASNMNIKLSGRFGRGKFSGLGETAEFWSSTCDGNPITTRLFKKGDGRICRNKLGEAYIISVRCVKD